MLKLLRELPSLLSDKEKKNFYLIFPFMLVTMVLETAGLGLVIPIIKIIFEDGFIDKYFFF